MEMLRLVPPIAPPPPGSERANPGRRRRPPIPRGLGTPLAAALRAATAGCLLASGVTGAQSREAGAGLRAALEKHRHELRVQDGRVAGEGVEWLREEARRSQ